MNTVPKQARRITQLTLREILTAAAVLVVIIAIAIPMWRTHQLRERRQDAMDALHAVQTAQDNYFGQHARYASESQLGGKPSSSKGYYKITVRKSDDDLTYSAAARVIPLEGEIAETRCVELRIDQNGRRFAVDAEGVDRSADCWH